MSHVLQSGEGSRRRLVHWFGVSVITGDLWESRALFFISRGAVLMISQASTMIWKATSEIKPPLRAHVNNTPKDTKMTPVSHIPLQMNTLKNVTFQQDQEHTIIKPPLVA